MRASERRLLETLLAIPTAPFREHWVQEAIERTARKLELPARRDPFGNLYVSYRKGRAAPVAFTAHMDHPGFEILAGGTRARALLLGGIGPEYLAGTPVLCFAAAAARPDTPVRGEIARVTPKSVAGQRPELHLEISFDAAVQAGDFGVFDLPGLVLEGDRLYSRALDNLLSCVLILGALASLQRRGISADVQGVFTRAEEVGFVGAGGVLRSSLLDSSRPVVVLETSKELPGFHLGGGPVLRVGDRMTCFDPRMDLWLASRAADLASRDPDFHYQRALMTGGNCEASLYMLHGRAVGAIALALGNYHNMTPEQGIDCEYIDVRDFEQTLSLLEHLAAHAPEEDLAAARRVQLDAVFDRLSPRLTPGT